MKQVEKWEDPSFLISCKTGNLNFVHSRLHLSNFGFWQPHLEAGQSHRDSADLTVVYNLSHPSNFGFWQSLHDQYLAAGAVKEVHSQISPDSTCTQMNDQKATVHLLSPRGGHAVRTYT